MANYIVIDGGTTNTRISLVINYIPIETIKINIGAKKSIDCLDTLKLSIKDAITKLLVSNSLVDADIECIIASGMITSEFGLCCLEHITIPAGVAELHNCMHKIILSEISDIPFVFIRGVKTTCNSLESADMMRGEETELIGIMQNTSEECIYILPGSHSKIIYTDTAGRIIEFKTMLTGEMIEALSQNTILKDAVDLSVCTTDREYLIKGYKYCKSHNINESLFKARILKNIFHCSSEQIYSFFMGVVLCGEIEQILKSKPRKIIIGGKSQIKTAMTEILKLYDNKSVIELPDKIVDNSTLTGAIKIYEY